MSATNGWIRPCRRRRRWPGPDRGRFLGYLLALLLGGTAQAWPAFVPDRAGFSVRFEEEIIPHTVFGVFVMPEARVEIEAIDSLGVQGCTLEAAAGIVESVGFGKWQWRAPADVGHVVLEVANPRLGKTIVLNAFVMAPYNHMKKGYLNGYRIDAYPNVPLRGLEIYNKPAGFVEVTEQTVGVLVSPHFKLGDFLCKQRSGYPKYLVLKERLVLKLEMILEAVNKAGYACETLTIMSGYRTPFYNRAIGNVRYSRHVWGGAVDFYVDAHPKDGTMDDLNRDGKINYRDAAVLYDLVDAMFGQPWYRPFVGGLGQYEKTAARGPFVHTDVRGFRARWGK